MFNVSGFLENKMVPVGIATRLRAGRLQF